MYGTQCTESFSLIRCFIKSWKCIKHCYWTITIPQNPPTAFVVSGVRVLPWSHTKTVIYWAQSMGRPGCRSLSLALKIARWSSNARKEASEKSGRETEEDKGESYGRLRLESGWSYMYICGKICTAKISLLIHLHNYAPPLGCTVSL